MKLKFVIASCGVLLFSIISFAQTQDSIKTYQLSNVDVVARKIFNQLIDFLLELIMNQVYLIKMDLVR